MLQGDTEALPAGPTSSQFQQAKETFCMYCTAQRNHIIIMTMRSQYDRSTVAMK
jgi:hypothetical protein